MFYLNDSKFHNLIERIRRRPNETVSGQWFNVITFGTYNFIQGNIIKDNAPNGFFRNIASIVDTISIEDIAGFWPEVQGHPVTIAEESALVDYIASRGAHEVELIVPERNRSRPVDWDRFDETPEFKIYNRFIYPSIIDTIENIDEYQSLDKLCLCPRHIRTVELESTSNNRLLDMGCGCGNLIESINRKCCSENCERQWECCGCGNIIEVLKRRIPRFQCYGVDINPANIDAAEEREIPNIHLGDSERIDEIFPSHITFDMIIFSGLLNRQVTSREKAESILRNALEKLNRSGYVIITGYTSCHFTADDLSCMGIDVMGKSIPNNIFKEYSDYYLRQLYLGRKID